MDWKEIGCYVGIKFDGTACNISTGDGKVKIVSEDGMDYTKNLPTMVKELSKFPEMVFPAELELWIGGKHAPRATSAGVLNAKRAVENEKHIRANVYDMLYFEGKDLHNLPYSERLKYMAKLKDTKHVVKTSRTLCTTEAQVRKAIEKYSSSRSSEGAMLKLANFKYELDKKTKYVLKFKKELQLRAQVIKINKVKGTTGTYSYVCALTGPEGLHYIGKTFNTKIKADIGDTINVSFVDVYAYEDKETGKKWANWYAPHVISKDTKNPDSISKAWKMAEETTGVKETKKEPKVKDFSSKKKRWVAQFHIRGGSVHIDFRTEENGYLRGFTLAPAVSEKFLKEIETHWELKKEKGVRSLYWDGELAYQFDTKGNVTKKASLSMRSKIYRWHVTFMKNPDLWKMDMKTGEELKRKTKTGETAQKIYALRKKIEPLEWLTVKGVTAPREVEDVPGGTALFPGVFVEIDSGTYDMGTRKVYYHEYFLKGSKWKGRFIFRQVAGLKDTKKHLTWLYWKADTTLPYALCFTPSNSIYTPTGIKRVEDLMIDNQIYSDKFTIDKVICNNPLHYSGDVFLIKPRYLSAIEVTKEHPIFVREIKRVHDKLMLTSNPFWIKPNEIETPSKYRKLAVAIPKIKEEVPYSFDLDSFSINKNRTYGSLTVDEDMAYFFGWFLAEGSSIPEKGTVYLVLNINEIIQANKIKTIVESIFKSKVNIRIRKQDHSQRIEIFNTPLSRFLETEFGRGAKNKRIPSWLLLERKSIISRFMDGLSEGDGSKDKSYYAGVSENIARMSQLLLLKLGKISTYFSSKFNSHFGSGILYSCDISKNYSQINLHFEDEDYFWFPILQVNRRIFDGLVYPISCNNSLLLSPFISHNSKRAVRESWFPKGYSALPEDLENKVPSDLNYWKTGLTGKQRTERRNELILKLKETLKKREMSALELDFIKPLKPYKGEDYTNEFFSVKDLKGFDCSNKIIGPKVDGLRMQIMKQGNSVKCYSAYGNQFALHKLGFIPEEIRKIDAHSFILDGELYLAGKGHNEVHEAVTTDGSSDFRFMAFDILHANGIDLENKPLIERKKYLNCVPNSEHISKEPIARFNSDKELVKLVEKLRPDFEGAVIKDLSSTYFEPKKLWKMIFIEKQFKELDALDHNSLGDMKVVCSRLERKVQEGRAIPISFDKLSSISAKVNALLEAASYSGEFVLSRRYWRGQEVVRGQEVEDFHIKFPGHRFHLDGNPIDKDVTATCFRRESEQNEYFIAGEYESGTEINPNKKIKANIEILDKGSIKIIETGPKVTKVKFSGIKLKGIHTFKRTTSLGTIWSMIKGDSSKGSMSRNISFQFKDFMVKVGQKTNKLIDDIKFPYIKEAVAFSEGTWHNRFYPWEEIRKSAPLLVGKPIGTPGLTFEAESINDGSEMVLEHSDGILENVGNVKQVWIDDKNKKLDIKFEIIDTSTGKDCALLIENEKIPAVSVRIEEDEPIYDGTLEVSTGILSWPHVALVRHPAVDNAMIKN